MASWLTIPPESDFSTDNLPYGVFSTAKLAKRIGVAIGEHVLDLKTLSQEIPDFSKLPLEATLENSTLNAYAALPKHVHQTVRSLLREILSADTQLGPTLRDNDDLRSKALISTSKVTMHLPFDIGDYTDFFLSPFHAVKVSKMPQTARLSLSDRCHMNRTYTLSVSGDYPWHVRNCCQFFQSTDCLSRASIIGDSVWHSITPASWTTKVCIWPNICAVSESRL